MGSPALPPRGPRSAGVKVSSKVNISAWWMSRNSECCLADVFTAVRYVESPDSYLRNYMVYILFMYVYVYNMYIHTRLLFHPKQLNHWVPQLFGSADTQKAIFGAMEQIKKQMKHLAKICHASRCCRWLYIYDYCIDVGVCIYIYYR